MKEPSLKTRGKRVYARQPLSMRFWSKVQSPNFGSPVGIADCWLWSGAVASNGYGSFRTFDRAETAHSVAWQLHTGLVVPHGFDVCHTCDVRLCCNPLHLFLGTRGDNMRDASSKGRLVQQRSPERMPRGERHHQARLTASKVRIIRDLHRDGVGRNHLARAFGVTPQNIRLIVTGKTWREHAIRSA